MTRFVAVQIFLVAACPAALAAPPAELKLAGDWELQVTVGGNAQPGAPRRSATLHIDPPVMVSVVAERHNSLPVFNASAGGWVKGAQLREVRAQETTTPYLLEPSSLVLRAGPTPEAAEFTAGKDYEADLNWGTIGRLQSGGIKEGQPIYASYRYAPLRLDSVVVTGDGRLVLKQGEARSAAPAPPKLEPGERLCGNIWVPGRVAKLGPEHLFPVLENAYPAAASLDASHIRELLPKTMQKLHLNQPLRVLAWGDSVTDGTFLPQPARDRWQEQFIAGVRERFPQSKIELVTEAWGGRNTASYLAEPPGSAHNYREKVLASKADLIVSEFVNDAGLNPAQVEERYSKLLRDFQEVGAEWIILTPHYVRPDWMGLTTEREIDKDPRPYVAGLREFAVRHNVALADAALRYGRLWRQGIPYTSLLLNSINHPDARGMKLFADALLELFPRE